MQFKALYLSSALMMVLASALGWDGILVRAFQRNRTNRILYSIYRYSHRDR